MDETEEQLTEELKTKRICRFCLTQDEPLSDIFNAPADSSRKTAAPLALQIMACVSIEVYGDDGMPCTICDNCRLLMDQSYRFKQICKKADTLLKTYPLTGVWPEKLQVPSQLFRVQKTEVVPVAIVQNPSANTRQSHVQPKAASVAGGATLQRIAPAPKQTQESQGATRQKTTTILRVSPVKMNKVNGDEQSTEEEEEDVKPKIVQLSIEDLKNIKQGKPIGRAQLIKKASPISKGSEVKVLRTEVVVPAPKSTPNTTTSRSSNSPRKVNVINGNLNNIMKKPVILNSLKPLKKTEEHFVHTAEGTLEIISMETPEIDPIKNAPPVETNVFPCGECERSFPLRQLLDIHMQNHNRERNYPCELCDKRFFSKYDLAKHNLTHTGERPFVCVICKSAFSRSTLLTRHQRIHKDQPKFLCMYCERTFLSDEELQKHAEHHQKKRPFFCKLCPKSFAYKQGLERHEVTHETNLPFTCEHCDLSFATAGKLARHLTAHAGSRPYPCRMCSRSFMLSHHLTRHVRSHQGGKGAYKCNDCTSIFYSQDELIYHSAVHATKSLTCPLCREHFETLELVTEHIKQHSEGLQYACDYCDLLFTNEQRLDVHCQQEHLSVLAMDRTEQNDDEQQQFIIEEIAINNDGSKMITTFVDGEQKEKKFVQKEPVIKNEVMVESIGRDNQEQHAKDEDEDDQQGEGEEYYFEEEAVGEEQVQDVPEPAPVKRTAVNVIKKLEQVSVEKKRSTLKAEIPKPSASIAKATQQKLETLFNKPLKNLTPAAPKSVGEVLKSLPKGMTIKRPSAAPPKSPSVEKKVEPSQYPASKPVTPKATATQGASPKKASPVSSSTKKLRTSDPPKAVAEKPQPVKSSPRTGTKRPNEDAKSPSPTKRLAVESKKPAGVSVSGSATPKPVPKPVPTGIIAASDVVKKPNKTFEMKIGDKMVKVQKVVMTKAEVAAMARDGKIEMQGDTMILKQPKIRKQ